MLLIGFVNLIKRLDALTNTNNATILKIDAYTFKMARARLDAIEDAASIKNNKAALEAALESGEEFLVRLDAMNTRKRLVACFGHQAINSERVNIMSWHLECLDKAVGVEAIHFATIETEQFINSTCKNWGLC